MKLFYASDLRSGTLEEEESLHALRILRLKEGDEIFVTDGNGTLARAQISQANKKKCSFTILENTKAEPFPYYLHIALAPTKNIDRTEWFVEKSVEFGIQEISFLLCERSERKNINTDRIHKIAVSAMKQSGNIFLPKINGLIKFDSLISTVKTEAGFIAHLEEGNKKHLKDSIARKGNYCVLIGPEGDFSPEEITTAVKSGFKPVSLGSSRLRTETAGIAAAQIVSLVNT